MICSSKIHSRCNLSYRKKNNMGRSTQSETQEYWKNIWEKKFLHNTNTRSLVDLRADHSNLSEQEPVNITVWQTDEDTV